MTFKFTRGLLVPVLAVAPLFGAYTALDSSSAEAAVCATASVTTYTAAGFSCSVGELTFSNIAVAPSTSGSGVVALTSVAPFAQGNESGLELIYSSNTGTTAGSTADVAWTYNVTSSPNSMIDAFVSLAGTTTGTGTANVGETLSNGTALNLGAPGSTTANFNPTTNLGVIKDQNDFSGSSGSASSSILQNGFSVNSTPVSSTPVPPGSGGATVPEPVSVTLLGTGLIGLGIIRRRRNHR